ncbi:MULTISPECIES: glycoside hydrolase family 10 protein [unclassified Streptomyces]|uniref:glycoside hydrolase family 10 protein n=1 Tax=unclassified Streptomyces TaxID=2593676 RepID=UPI00224DE39F|nr:MULTISPECIES: family 10 glycosylhydrolase [unclassified Streptomyces]MCX5139099.1 family 10 glycosylhydrolase [Streptomyces sp. NBC_00338]WRZ63799.1 family 10 glycosylhydrolase [Streptomyces sp. NBC_01257]WSU57763.1 family 10 glycosylhydrolase [Streptomyces sp. NBC_01104]
MRHMERRKFVTGAAGTVAGVIAPAAVAGDAAAVPRGRGPGRPGAPRDALRRELRGMWVATVENLDWPAEPGLSAAAQRAGLTAFLDEAVDRRLNAVVLQVRPSADALWPSPHEPWAACLTGVQGRDPGWDPLGTAVQEAHARGLELHAWFNPYRVANHTDLSRLSAAHPARLHPAWVLPYGGKLYYNPGLPEVRAFVQDAMLDAVRRYDIDAVHWDDYFYPYPVAGQSFADGPAYAKYGAGFPDKAAWRRDNTDKLVREMSGRIKALKPGVRFGISPFGVWRNASTDPLGSRTEAGVQTYDDLHADTRGWIKKGWIDYICPQLYWNIGFAPADYAELVPWWGEVVRGTGVDLFIGEALYKAGDPAQPAAWQDPAELSRHVDLAAGHDQARGHVYFSGNSVVRDRIGAMDRVVADHYQVRARPPR